MVQHIARLRVAACRPFLLAGIVGVACCAPRLRSGPAEAPRQTLFVTNRAYLDAIVYVEPCGDASCPVRIAQVTSGHTEQVTIKRGFLSDGRLALHVRSITNGYEYDLPSLTMGPGQNALLVVDEHFPRLVPTDATQIINASRSPE